MMRPFASLTSVLSLIACAHTSVPAVSLVIPPGTTAMATVWADSALFVFPPETRNSWGWPAGSPTDDDLKYAWGVTITSADTGFLAGATVARQDHPKPLESLEAAVGAAKPSLQYNPGGHALHGDPTTQVTVGVAQGRVYVTMRTANLVQRVFRARPRTVRFGVVAPFEPRWQQVIIDVRYADSL